MLRVAREEKCLKTIFVDKEVRMYVKQIWDQCNIPLLSSLTDGGVGFVLVMMGADHRELKSLMKKHIQSFLADVSPAVSFMRLMCVSILHCTSSC